MRNNILIEFIALSERVITILSILRFIEDLILPIIVRKSILHRSLRYQVINIRLIKKCLFHAILSISSSLFLRIVSLIVRGIQNKRPLSNMHIFYSFFRIQSLTQVSILFIFFGIRRPQLVLIINCTPLSLQIIKFIFIFINYNFASL